MKNTNTASFSAWLKALPRRWFVDAMSSMALGLFASLLIGTIFSTIAKIPHLEFFATISTFAQGATGMAIGVAIAYRLKMPPLVIFSAAVVGSIGNSMGAILSAGSIVSWAAVASRGGEGEIFYTAGPAGAFFATVIACEIGNLVSGKTKVDILVTPLVTILAGFGVSWLLCPVIAYAMYYLGDFINTATEYQPVLMGVVISVVVGMVLTLPISSAAICAMIGITGLAGGAAAVGCCAQMVGFAVISFRENKWSGLVSQGLGTSMLQMGNICKNPLIWLPPTLAAAITGPISTTIFKLKCSGVSAGMGTCGLVGPIGIISATENTGLMWAGLILLCLVLPAILSLFFSEVMRRLGLIKENDLLLDSAKK